MCTGRVDLSFVLRAFLKGADGVIVGGCWLGECHYVTEGNYDALGNMHLCKKLFEQIGVSPERLRIEWIAASEGTRFAEIMSDFSRQIRELGPLGRAEGLGDADLNRKLEAVNQLVPYMKLVAKDMRVPTKSEKAYEEFYGGDEFRRLFDELIAGKLALREILLLLEEGARSSAEISEQLGMSASAVAGHLDYSVSRGMIASSGAGDSYSLAEGWTSNGRVVSYYIDPDECKACLICMRKCPSKVIDGAKKKIHIIDQEECGGCGVCYEVCPPKFSAVRRLVGEPVPSPISEEQRLLGKNQKRVAKPEAEEAS